MIKAKLEDTVTVRYTGRLPDGEVFDQSPEDRPLKFILGKKEVIEGFEEAVEGMYRGESKTVNIPCTKAYGESDPELYEKVDKSLFDDQTELQVGGQLEVTNPDDSKFYLMIREVGDDHVILDANHPLADKDLVFDIELLDVKNPE
jgi:peptidylprolyl isomerase